MKYTLLLLTVLSFTTCGFGQKISAPVIKSTGGIYSIENLDKLPDAEIEYKIVVDIKSGPNSPDQINPALNNIARMLNLHVTGGVNPDNITVVGVIHNLATPSSQDDEMYMKRFNVENPNNQLLNELTEAGVEIYVCGQSLVARKYGTDNLNKNVKTSISALTILTEYTQKGYTLLSF